MFVDIFGLGCLTLAGRLPCSLAEITEEPELVRKGVIDEGHVPRDLSALVSELLFLVQFALFLPGYD